MTHRHSMTALGAVPAVNPSRRCSDGPPVNDTYAPFQQAGFRSYFAARVLSVVGSQMLSVAVGWQMYALTNDPKDLGYVGLVQFLPQLVLFPVAGTVADRARRNRILVVCYGLFFLGAVLLAGMSATHHVSREGIFAALTVIALGRAFGSPASQSLLPQLVPAEAFPRAASWSSSAFGASVITGPAIGGAIYGLVEGQGGNGAFAAYALAAACIAGAIAAASTLPDLRAVHEGEPPGWGQALDGVRFIWAKKILLAAITLDLFAVLFGGAVALLPIFARDVLHTGPEGLGMLRAAPAVGSLGMAVFLAYRPLERNLGFRLYTAVALFGVATIAFALSTNLWLSMLALLVTGAADEISVFVRLNVVQAATPNHVRGRVSAAEFVFIGASNELGALESGMTAAWWGAVPSVLFGGLASIVVVLVGAGLSRQLRQVDRLADVRNDPDRSMTTR